MILLHPTFAFVLPSYLFYEQLRSVVDFMCDQHETVVVIQTDDLA